MTKPDPSITADLLSHLPTRKSDLPKEAAQHGGHHDHNDPRGPLPAMPKVSPKSAEKAAGPGRTRMSNRGK